MGCVELGGIVIDYKHNKEIVPLAKAKLIIELDGSQHYEDNEMEKDTLRTEFLKQYGLKVIGFNKII